MKLYHLSSALLLGAAAARQPAVFGRRSMHKSSPLERIRSAGQDAAKAAKKITTTQTAVAPKSAKTSEPSSSDKKSELSSKSTNSRDSNRSSKTSKPKAYKTFKKPASFTHQLEISPDVPAIRSKASNKYSKVATSPDSPVIRSKASKKYSEVATVWDESMSYDFDPTDGLFFESGSSFSYGFSMPDVETTTSVAPPSTTVPPPEPVLDENFGRVIFEYLSQCAGLELDTSSCLVSKTVDVFMSMGDNAPDEGVFGRVRSLQAANGKPRFLQGPEDECAAPDIDEDEVRAIMSVTREQCEADISDGEFNTVLGTFMRLFANQGCWDSLCSEGIETSKLFFSILFDDAAKCAGVELDVDQCVKNHIIDLVLLVEPDAGQDPTAGRVRRFLQQEECDQPSPEDLSFFVAFMLIDADAKCSGQGIDLESTDWDAVSDDLVTIFSSPECWGIEDCREEVEVVPDSSLDLPTAEVPVDDEEERIVLTADGRECTFDMNPDPELERSLELTYYYRVETSSAEPNLSSIEAALIELACNDARSERKLGEYPQDTVVVAINSSPDDAIHSECLAEDPAATGCYVIEGASTLILEGTSTEYDEEFESGAYSKIEELFAYLPNVLDGSNVVDVQYLGQELPTEDTAQDEPTIASINSAEDVSEDYIAVIAAAAGGVVAMAMIIGGFHRMQKDKENTQDVMSPDDKSNDGSNDGQSTAYNTADLTYAASCDHSDYSLPSPARSINSVTSPTSHRGGSPEVAKFFILAEEEEENWRELSILPALAQDDGTLEDVSEEGSFVGSTSSSESGEMSV